ncbi:MAG: TonB-dependent siderophore receptor [Campylobacteraceae bacterium]|nr:TonB-dependent siderophore receptor [Campylobacteraceae bacterium]
MKKTNLNKLLCASILSLCTVNVLFAQSTKTDFTQEVTSYEESAYGELKGYVATKSSTGSKMDLDITDIPQSVSVITNDMIEDRNAKTIMNITSYTASIFQPYSENSEKRANYGNIRGVGSLYRSSFLDGLKLLYGGHLIPSINPYALERVEVLKGPSSVLYGASGVGGLLNLQSKKANTSNEKEVGISYGTHKNKSVFADVNHTINERVSVRLTSKFNKGDNALDKSSHNSYFFNPAIKYNINDTTSLDILLSTSKDEINGLGYGFSGTKQKINIFKNFSSAYSHVPGMAAQYAQIVNANLSSSMYVGLPDKENYDKKRKAVTLLLQKHINEDMKFSSSFNYTKMDGSNGYSVPNAAGLTALATDLSDLPLTFIQTKHKVDSIALDNSFQYKWDTKNTTNTSLFGLDIQKMNHEERNSTGVNYKFDVLNPDYSQRITDATTLSSNTDNSSTQIGFYAQNQMTINEKLILSLSLRYDKLKEEVDNNLTNTSKSYKHSKVSNRMGLTYKFDNGLAPYVSYSTSFEGNPGSATVSGKKFKPSIGKQYEAGLKFKPKNINAFYTLAVFETTQSDKITRDTSSTDASARIQEGGVKVKGIEFDAVFKPLENSNLVFSIAKLKGEEIDMPSSADNGRKLSNLPKLNASIWADYIFKNTSIGDLKLGTGIKYIGKSKLLDTNYFAAGTPQELYENPSYTLVDTVISTVYKDVKIALNINNLFNKEVNIANNAISSTETEGRTYNIALSFKF